MGTTKALLSARQHMVGMVRLFDDEPVGCGQDDQHYLSLITNILAWLWALAHQRSSDLLGAASLAYTFGLRHAVDPDHIAAIDNVAQADAGGKAAARRRFLRPGHRPWGSRPSCRAFCGGAAG